MANSSLLIVAGERSGDVYGAELAKELRARLDNLEIFGCGGDAMRQAGVETTIDAHAVTMAGIVEVVSGLPRAYRAFHNLQEEVDRRRPALAVLIDFPDFNLRLAKKLKERAIPVVYFVSPQIWAWRKGRLRQMKANITKMICIFDFEESIYREAGIPVEYVGHPLVDLARPRMTREEFYGKAGLSLSIPTVALLPGSRKKEVAHNLPPMLAAAARLASKRQLQFVIPIAPTLNGGWMESLIRKTAPRQAVVRTIEHATHDALEHAEIAVVASGTATLEAALHERPMVVVYRVSPLTWLVGKLLVDVPHYSIVNLLAKKPLVAELMQGNFTASNVASHVEYLLDHPEARDNIARELRALRERLGKGGAIAKAAEIVINACNARKATTQPR